MLTLAATWTAVVLGIGVMLIMAVGPAVAELDGRLAERRRSRPATPPRTHAPATARAQAARAQAA